MNKQIAEKLGWVKLLKPGFSGFETPDGKEIHYSDADFTHSMDACVKYIVPWLREKNLFFVLRQYDHYFQCRIVAYNDETRAFDESEAPALALCKAFMEV